MDGIDASTRPRGQAWSQARRVLAIRLDNLGDVLMTTPALAAIKRGLPDAHLTLLASPSGASATPHLPMLDDVIVHEAPWTPRAQPASATDDRALLARMEQGRFDAAVVFGVCTQSALPAALMCRLAGIPLRLAYCRENPYELLTDWAADREQVQGGMRHEVQRQLDLVRTVGFHTADPRMVFRLRGDDMRHCAERLALCGVGHAPYAVVHVGASAPSRRYPIDRFAAAADSIAQRTGCRIVFTGSAAEAALIEGARARMQSASVSLAGQLTLGELGALLSGARVLVSNNTGPVHIASALGTPVAVLYALTNPQHTPWMTPSRVLFDDVPCRYCLKSVCPQGHHACLSRVEPEAVARAAEELMALPREEMKVAA